jgi:hypothetical protein
MSFTSVFAVRTGSEPLPRPGIRMLATVLRDTQCTADMANNRLRHGKQISLARADPDERFLASDRFLPHAKYPILGIISQVRDALREYRGPPLRAATAAISEAQSARPWVLSHATLP